ncbi:F-box/LRR-repeat protein At4g29420 [Malania oleifera]|uniref:F-box/LRR-repeat protein At4g29420 n=1 Tax=Malania oleifera TaxID=397392 RepID=UPI0025ADEFE8|nr:F-box/LRR-repeat protein At4g29420 [Malania oleifera]
MDDLPPPLILDILTRLSDSADLAHCRAASKTLNAVAGDVRSVNLLCTFDRFLKLRSLTTKTMVTPFKTVLKNLVLSSRDLESVSVGVDRLLRGIDYDDVEDESDDLYLTDVGFVAEWLPRIGERLRSLLISDYWVQSCWRRSEVLSLISSCCQSLLHLELKNAWLSVDGLKPMLSLTSLTLEFIRLDDEDLNKVNECFPSLQVLNLIGVGGLKEPNIHLLHLKTCQWTVSNAPLSLTIHAPNLIDLKLKCVKPKLLVLKTPFLSKLHLVIDEAGKFEAKEFLNLKTLQLECSSVCSLASAFASGRTIKKLIVDSPKWAEPFSIKDLFDVFPSVISLTLNSGAWLGMESCYRHAGLEDWSRMKNVKEIIAYVVVYDIQSTLAFIFSILDACTNLVDIALLIHREVDADITSRLMSKCTSHCPRLRWRWGMWKEGMKYTWFSDVI